MWESVISTIYKLYVYNLRLNRSINVWVLIMWTQQ